MSSRTRSRAGCRGGWQRRRLARASSPARCRAPGTAKARRARPTELLAPDQTARTRRCRWRVHQHDRDPADLLVENRTSKSVVATRTALPAKRSQIGSTSSNVGSSRPSVAYAVSPAMQGDGDLRIDERLDSSTCARPTHAAPISITRRRHLGPGFQCRDDKVGLRKCAALASSQRSSTSR